jgi:flagellar biosynthesis protein FlhF
MKITRHLAPDMRQALKAVKEQLGPDAVILSSRRTPAGVEITAAMDFDAEEIHAASSFNAPAAPDVMPVNAHTAAQARAKIAAQVNARATAPAVDDRAAANAAAHTAEHTWQSPQDHIGARSAHSADMQARGAAHFPQSAASQGRAGARSANGEDMQAHTGTQFARSAGQQGHADAQFAQSAGQHGHAGARSPQRTDTQAHAGPQSQANARSAQGTSAQALGAPRLAPVPSPGPRPMSQTAALLVGATSTTARSQPVGQVMQALAKQGVARGNDPRSAGAQNVPHSYDTRHLLEEQAAKAANLAEHAMAAADFAPEEFLNHAPRGAQAPQMARSPAHQRQQTPHTALSNAHPGLGDRTPQAFVTQAPRQDSVPHDFGDDSYEAAHNGIPTAQPADIMAAGEAQASPADLMGAELKTLRRMLETQLAQLAWNDLSRRAPVHTEMLRELTEIGLGPELAAQVVAQLPAHMDLTQARRLSIATLSQQVQVTGDRWLENGGRVALVGPTGVGKTTTLTKLAVRWVLRHGPRDLAIVAGDSLRIGAHEQLNTLGQLLGARVYPLQNLEDLPALLGKLKDTRFVLIDTPGSSQRDAQLASRFAALNAVSPQLETALVLGASTQAGANAEVVQRFAAVNPASCVLTKVDEAASLGGLLSILVRAGLPISYMSEGQRVPEDLRPARSLELVSSAVQLAQTAGAAADEDLLRRRFGEMAHAIA